MSPVSLGKGRCAGVPGGVGEMDVADRERDRERKREFR